MTLITRWDPYRDLATLQNRVNRLFQESPPAAAKTSLDHSGAFVPPVDVYEDEQGLRLKLEVPGIDEKDLDVRVENNVLSIRGERKFEKEEKEENFHRIERRYGSFSRTFTLPTTVDTEKVSADYKNGVLTLQLVKKAEAKPKQIKVNIGTQPCWMRKRPQPRNA